MASPEFELQLSSAGVPLLGQDGMGSTQQLRQREGKTKY